MLKAVLLICFSLHYVAIAASFEVLDYSGENLAKRKTKLPNLLRENAFEGRYFKIVEGKNESAVMFGAPLNQRAAQVYYHLEKAREYFLSIEEAPQEWLNQQITIRLNISNHFNPYSRFSHDDYARESNTAVTIPGSGEERMEEFGSWGPEIWFRPKKLARSSAATEALSRTLEGNQSAMMEGVARSLVLNATANAAQGELLKDIFSKDALVLGALSFGLIKALPSITRFFGRTFKQRFYLDTAMVPEIIYHEYAHFALAHHVDLVSTPVIEGLANYYAGRIANKARWGNRPRQHSRDIGRSAYDKVQYSFAQERKDYATSSFVFKFLWSLADIAPKPDSFIYRASHRIDQNADIKMDLVEAIIFEAETSGLPLNKKLRIHRLLQSLGL